MIFWIVLASIVGLIALILICPIQVILLYDGKLTVKAGIPFLHFRVFPGREADLESDTLSLRQKRRLKKKLMKKLSRAERKAEKARAKGKKPPKALSDTLKKKKSKGIIKDLGRIFRMVRILAAKFGKKLHVKIKCLEIVAASDDAAKTAYLFGALSQMTAYALAAADAYTNVKFNNKRVKVLADFTSETIRVKTKILFSMRVGSLLSLAFSALLLFAKESLLQNPDALLSDEKGKEEGASHNTKNEKGISA